MQWSRISRACCPGLAGSASGRQRWKRTLIYLAWHVKHWACGNSRLYWHERLKGSCDSVGAMVFLACFVYREMVKRSKRRDCLRDCQTSQMVQASKQMSPWLAEKWQAKWAISAHCLPVYQSKVQWYTPCLIFSLPADASRRSFSVCLWLVNDLVVFLSSSHVTVRCNAAPTMTRKASYLLSACQIADRLFGPVAFWLHSRKVLLVWGILANVLVGLGEKRPLCFWGVGSMGRKKEVFHCL